MPRPVVKNKAWTKACTSVYHSFTPETGSKRADEQEQYPAKYFFRLILSNQTSSLPAGHERSSSPTRALVMLYTMFHMGQRRQTHEMMKDEIEIV